jgi:cobalt transporter subunit CbtA
MAWTAAVAGILAGLLLSALQAVWVGPLFRLAERYESGEAPLGLAGGSSGSAGGGSGNAGADAPAPRAEWMPAEGLERIAYTVLADVLAAVGFALLLLAGMTLQGGAPSPAGGVLWGCAGYAAFVLGPALGLPPELPGAVSAALEERQIWWAGTVAATAGGLALLAFAPRGWARALGALLLLAPHAVGAPEPPIAFAEPLPPALSAQFVAAVLVTSAAFWAVLGALCGWGLGRGR